MSASSRSLGSRPVFSPFGHVIQSFLEVELFAFLLLKCPTICSCWNFDFPGNVNRERGGKRRRALDESSWAGANLPTTAKPHISTTGNPSEPGRAAQDALCKHLGLTAAKKSCIDDDSVLAPADIATSVDHRSLHIHAALALLLLQAGRRAAHFGLVWSWFRPGRRPGQRLVAASSLDAFDTIC